MITLEKIIKNSEPHPSSRHRNDGSRIYREEIGDYILSIVGGGVGLYGDFENNFEVAVIDKKTGNFSTGLFSRRGDEVLGFATFDEILEIYYNIPR